jgi:hypothetical protein
MSPKAKSVNDNDLRKLILEECEFIKGELGSLAADVYEVRVTMLWIKQQLALHTTRLQYLEKRLERPEARAVRRVQRVQQSLARKREAPLRSQIRFLLVALLQAVSSRVR